MGDIEYLALREYHIIWWSYCNNHNGSDCAGHDNENGAAEQEHERKASPQTNFHPPEQLLIGKNQVRDEKVSTWFCGYLPAME